MFWKKSKTIPLDTTDKSTEVDIKDKRLGYISFSIGTDLSIHVYMKSGKGSNNTHVEGVPCMHMAALLYHLNSGALQPLVMNKLLEEGTEDPSGYAASVLVEWNKLVQQSDEVVVSPSLALGIGIQFRKAVEGGEL